MKELRRKDREISEGEALSILNSAEYGILSTASQDAIPYGIPLSFCIIDSNIYFHCAMEGRKIENLENNKSVSFCVVGKTEILSSKFSTKYESTIVSGDALEVFNEEKQIALEGLVKKYSPEFIESGEKYIDALTDKTRVFKVVVSRISGKSRKK
jgi:nitroimidazol reductase NimA-like FMN-containing flavoprotein (pyridoxamine 5'-phosphate oxidase superfamily)